MFDSAKFNQLAVVSLSPATATVRGYPTYIAANPNIDHQFAIGTTEGTIYLVEPPDGQTTWK
jgi:hypothetical protein